MKAMVIGRRSSSPGLALVDVAPAELGDKQVRVAVRAASVNRADLAQLAGTHTSIGGVPQAQVVGLDAAGEIVEVGPGVTDYARGDRVMAMVAGGLAQEIVVDASMLIPIPTNWSFIEGAAAVLGFMTAHNALVTTARMTDGESVAIHAATSGVGMQAVQLARYFGAGLIVGTTRSDRGSALLGALGVHEVINTSSTDFAARALEITESSGIDIVLDHVGGSYLSMNIQAAAVKGRIVGVGRLGGAEGLLDMEALAFKRLELVGVTFRTRTTEERAEIVHALRRDIAAFRLDAAHRDIHESLRPVIARVLPWNEAEQAYRLMSGNEMLGKIVLEVG
ncbi:zinc-binding dehydrogenase [Rhodococcus sp. NPDC057014]|uniref:zinc-binding dehydrogenase n=1 Tax=Rhodococcus sp. NPDC057014 TaxID=3346000 RepID=UPI00363C2BF4